MSGTVYHIFCTVTGKAYVGQTWGSLEKRWREHCVALGCGKLHGAIRKYGSSRFVRTILTSSLTTQEQMDAAEVYWIQFFDCCKNGYNLKTGGSHGKHATEVKEKMSAIRSKFYSDPSNRELASIGALRRFSDPMQVERNRQGQLKRFSDPLEVEIARQGALRRFSDPVACRKSALDHGGKPFVCDQTGATFISQSEAAKTLGISATKICAVLKGRRQSTKGYTFHYLES